MKVQLNIPMPKPAAQASAWQQIMRHTEPVIQGMPHVVGGNSYRAARPPGGGLCVCHQDLQANSSGMSKIKDWVKREFTMPSGSGEKYSGMLGGAVGLSIFHLFRWMYRQIKGK